MSLSFWYHIIKMITHNIINDTVYIGKHQEKQKSIQSIQILLKLYPIANYKNLNIDKLKSYNYNRKSQEHKN